MDTRNIALLITFLLGLFIVIGVILAFFLKKKKQVLDFIFAFALSLLSMLIIVDLWPEIREALGLQHLYLFLIFASLGFLGFKVLDNFIPEHEETKMSQIEKQHNMVHIGTLATIALIIHNIVEGMAIFIATTNNLSLGLVMSLGVGFHNIPLGIIITTTFYQSGVKNKHFPFYLGLLVLSNFVGGLILYLFHLTEVSPLLMGSILSLTLGMLLYIIIFELYPKVRKTAHKKVTVYGLAAGVLLLICTMFLE